MQWVICWYLHKLRVPRNLEDMRFFDTRPLLHELLEASPQTWQSCHLEDEQKVQFATTNS